jgi:hypothetical protein
VIDAIKILDDRNSYTPIELDFIKFNNAISKINNSHVCGFDKISAFMLKNTPDYFKNSSFFCFYKFIFKNCIFPDNLNISFIKPIIKLIYLKNFTSNLNKQCLVSTI